LPTNFTYKGQSYASSVAFRDSLDMDLDDYVEVTSFLRIIPFMSRSVWKSLMIGITVDGS